MREQLFTPRLPRKKSKKTITPKSYHVQCWHCTGKGKITRALLDTGGYTKGFCEDKCTVCTGKGLVYQQEDVDHVAE